MTKRTVFAAAAAIFAAGSFATAAHADGVKCSGVNACKGQSACKMGSSSCKGQNACKGQGWTETTDVDRAAPSRAARSCIGSASRSNEFGRRDGSRRPIRLVLSILSQLELLSRAGNADVLLLSHRIGDRAAGLAVRGLL